MAANNGPPAGLGPGAQPWLNAVHGGLGWAIGTALAGVIWDVGGGQLVFVTASVIIAVGAAVFAFGTRR